MNLDNSYSHREYLKWKRNNVSYRGVQEVGKENGGSAILGNGLYTAALSNKSMSRNYGKVYFVVNAVPKNPLKFNTLNDWEIWFYNTLVYNFSKAEGKDYPDKRDFYAKTTIEDEVQKLGYDGVVIVGREMVNYTPPDNVKYFKTEYEVMDYYTRNILKLEIVKKTIRKHLLESIFKEALDNEFKPVETMVRSFADNLQIELGINLWLDAYPKYDSENYSMKLKSIIIPKEKRNEGIGTMAMQRIIDFANNNNLKIFLTPDTVLGATSKKRLIDFYRRLGFVPNKGKNKDWHHQDLMVYLPK